MQAIKDHIGPSSNLSYYFDANVVVDISASSQQVRVFPPDSKNPWSQVALYALVDITYDYVDDDNMGIFYLSVPGGVQEAVQKCINRICSGIR